MPTAAPKRSRKPKTRSTGSTNSLPAELPDEIDLFADFCDRVLTTEAGAPLHLHPFQRKMLTDLFNGCRETLILIPKKNGKTSMLGALGLFHLCTTPDAECVIAAASRDQAGIMLRQAQGFIRRSPALQERLQVKQREIVHKTLGGRIRILASDVDTVDGVIPTLALVDELHRHKSTDLYGIFRDGLGPRDGHMVTISTAGDDIESPLGKLRAQAHSLPVEREGAYCFAKTTGFVMHEWALESGDNLDDLELVKQANPAPWQTLEALQERKSTPTMQPWQWARFACGVWMSGEDGAISAKEWQACSDNGYEIPPGTPGVHLGIDLGWKWDTTAIVPVIADGDGVRIGAPQILVPPRDGTSLDAELIWEVIESAASRWPELTVVLDPEAGGEQLAQRIENELSVDVIAHSQKPSPMALAAQRFAELISARKLHHPDHPALTSHVLAAAAKPVGEGWRFVKSRRSKKPIDGAIAAAMATSVIVSGERAGSIYEEKELLVL